uniref:Uncharacterized protein n=1 Tax=viral metagenome TaxID=1070528 RepID=A0A6M3JTV4_9ZZZZ
MAQITFEKPEDIRKLIGLKIEDIAAGLKSGNSIITLMLSNPGAESKVGLEIISHPEFGRSGNVVVCNGALTFHSFDIEKAVQDDV